MNLFKAIRFTFLFAAFGALAAAPSAVMGFYGCDCEGCLLVGDKCYESDKCINGICNWNGPECDCEPD